MTLVDARATVVYACIAQLTTSLDLLSSDTDRHLVNTAQGIHGSLPYAYHFWCKYLVRCKDDDFTDDLLRLIHELCEIYLRFHRNDSKQQRRGETVENGLSKLLNRFSETDAETLQFLVSSKRRLSTLIQIPTNQPFRHTQMRRDFPQAVRGTTIPWC